MLFFKFWKSIKAARIAGDRARDAKDWATAARHYQTVVEREQLNAGIWVQFGHALKESGHYIDAENAYRKSIEIQPKNADTHLQLGHVLKLQGKIVDAIDAYLQALVLAPTLPDPLFELRALGCSSEKIGEAFWGSAVAAGPEPAGQLQGARLVFELTDLVEFVERSRAPTGVQRVQLRVITSLLQRPGRGFDIDFVVCGANPNFWVKLPQDLFVRLADLLVAGGQPDDTAWRAVVITLETAILTGKPYAFRRGATLLALGPTWSIPDYFLRLRLAKGRYGIRYIQVFYDTIPYSVPDLVPGLMTAQFIRWVVSLLAHADGLRAISDSSATDLMEFAIKLNRPIPTPQVVRLDGQFAVASLPGTDNTPCPIVRRYDLDRQPFVLFVATIEARKNHLATFEVWLAMIRKRGLERMPMLICIGKPGWMAEGALAFLDASELLKKKVVIVSHLGDADLAELYRRCLFTVFPSLYEGWGLPVTEALCYGRLPLIAATSSLHEAGGEWAEYFDPLSQRDMMDKLERLIDDKSYRESREAKIKDSFRPRSWDDIADEFVGEIPDEADMPGPAASETAVWAPRAEPGHYYVMALVNATEVWPGVINGEMYRSGAGWLALEPWGTWMNREIAEIAFSIPTTETPLVVYVWVRGLPGTSEIPEPVSDYEVRVLGTRVAESGKLSRDEQHWVLLSVAPDAIQDGNIRIRLSSSGSTKFGDGADARTVTMGVLGFYFCGADDLLARHRFLEALQLNRLQSLNGRPMAAASATVRARTATAAEELPASKPADSAAGGLPRAGHTTVDAARGQSA